MAENKPSLDWLDDIASLSAQLDKTPSATHAELAKALKLLRPYVSTLLALKPIFDPPTAEKVRQAAPSYVLSFYSVKGLVGLNGKVSDYPKAGREAVDQILTHHLTASGIKGLIDQITGGDTIVVTDESQSNPLTEGGPAFFERLGQRIGRGLDGLLGLRPQADLSPDPHSETLVKEGALAKGEARDSTYSEKSDSPKTSAAKQGGGIPNWIGKLIQKMVTHFVEHPAKSMQNLVLGIVQFIFWSILLCLLLWALHWGWTHFGREGFEKYVTSGLRPHAEGNDLSVSISKQDIGTSGPKADTGEGATQQVVTPVSQSNPSLNNSQVGTKPSGPANDGLSLQSLNKRTSPEIPDELLDRMSTDAHHDTDLAKRFFALSYKDDFDDWSDYFHQRLDQDYSKAFFAKYLSQDRQDEIKEKKLYMTFEPSDDPKLLKFDDFSDDFLVQGVLTTRSDLTYSRKLLSQKNVGLIVQVWHNTDGSEVLEKVTEVR
jgi:hypothetical protein